MIWVTAWRKITPMQNIHRLVELSMMEFVGSAVCENKFLVHGEDTIPSVDNGIGPN
jgi:hypothetical protein